MGNEQAEGSDNQQDLDDVQTEQVDAPEQEESEVVVTIGEEAPPTEEEDLSRAPNWVRNLRKEFREVQREKRELEGKLASLTKQDVKTPVLGPKPTLESHGYDDAAYEQALDSWYAEKRNVDDHAAKVADEQKAADAEWQGKLSNYNKAKSELKVKDFDDAEALVLAKLGTTQQGIIVKGAKNSAAVIYALGSNLPKLEEISAIKDPVDFAFAVATLETQLRITNRRAPPPPEQAIKGNAVGASAIDSQLERLRAEAEKTGDHSKVVAYKRSKRGS